MEIYRIEKGKIIEERNDARKNKEWAKSDKTDAYTYPLVKNRQPFFYNLYNWIGIKS